jgi:hypothetical protein
MGGSDKEAMSDQGHKCVECGAISPPTETNYTLISPRHGWRLTRAVDANGNKTMEWRCPSCWAKYRDRSKPPTKSQTR